MSVFPPTVKVVISSANLIEEDWDEWSQCIWTQDFFNLRDGETGVAAKRLDLEFRTQLITFLKRCECPEDRIFNLLRGVFFRNVRVRLVASVPGFFHSSSMGQFGHLRLRAILASLREFETAIGLEGKLPPILSLSSSMGSPSANWLRSILASCHGRNALPADVSIADAVHLVYPTVSYVQSSRIGPDMAGSLLFHARTYQSKSFPKKCLKRYKDAQGREGCLPQSTVGMAEAWDVVMNVPMKNRPRLPWIYVGSHNFTRSAWGALQKKDTELFITNYECGVVLLPKNYVDWMNGDLKIENHPKERTEGDLCEEVDLAFDSPCLPYRSVDRPFCCFCVS